MVVSPIAQRSKNVLHYLFALGHQIGSRHNALGRSFYHCLVGAPRNHPIRSRRALAEQRTALASWLIVIKHPLLAVVGVLALSFQSLARRTLVSILRPLITKSLLGKYFLATFAHPTRGAGTRHERLHTSFF